MYLSKLLQRSVKLVILLSIISGCSHKISIKEDFYAEKHKKNIKIQGTMSVSVENQTETDYHTLSERGIATGFPFLLNLSQAFTTEILSPATEGISSWQSDSQEREVGIPFTISGFYAPSFQKK